MRRHIAPFLVVGIAITMAVPIAASDAEQQKQSKQQKPQQPTTQKPTGSAARSNTVDLDELEDNPEKFLGKTVTVEGEVDRVLGPHLFTIDERDWVDAERELPVAVPEPFAALVRSDAPVRVTGTIQKVPIAQIQKDRTFFGDEKIKAEIETKPILVATDVVATQSGVSLRAHADQPVGTSGGAAGAPLTDPNQLAQATDKNLVGRRVDLKGVTVGATGDQGFWIQTPSGERIFVASANRAPVKEGQKADVQGLVLELPEGLRVNVKAAGEPIYIYAERVAPR
jgi:hypothetical protein